MPVKIPLVYFRERWRTTFALTLSGQQIDKPMRLADYHVDVMREGVQEAFRGVVDLDGWLKGSLE